MIKSLLEARMHQKNYRISVVIPAYNEAARIKGCLDALMRQTVKPYEIIVVDNNCTDTTVAIAQKYKGVKVVKESFQGRAAARDKGFNSAKGDIIARFDADTQLPPDWVARVTTEFANDPELAGLSGYGIARLVVGMPNSVVLAVSHFWSWVWFTHCRAFFGVEIMWGGNMAIRCSRWLKIKDLCIPYNNDIHEDIDISLAMASIGGKVRIMPSLLVSVDFYETEHLGKFLRYNVMKRRNRRLHYKHSRSQLKTFKKINWLKRLWYYCIINPFDVVYFIHTAMNSLARSIAGVFKR
jgi:glycosyltransferase involved in cell wall biosynthesis